MDRNLNSLEDAIKQLDIELENAEPDKLDLINQTLKSARTDSFKLDQIIENTEKQYKEGVNLEKCLNNVISELRQLRDSQPTIQRVVVDNQIQLPEQRENIRVSNLSDIKIPAQLSEISVKESKWLAKYIEPVLQVINKGFEMLYKKGQTVRLLDSYDPKKPIAVRLSDGNRFYNAITQVMGKIGSYSPFKDNNGIHNEALLDTNGILQVSGNLVNERYTKILVSYPAADTEVFTYKDGNTTVAIVTLTYTDSSKSNISLVEKT